MQENIDNLEMQNEKKKDYARKRKRICNKKNYIKFIKIAIINILPHRIDFDRFECSPLLLSRHFSISLTLYSEVFIY